MFKNFVILTALLTTACTHVGVDVGAYNPTGHTREVFKGDGGIAKFEVKAERKINENWSVYSSFFHVSNYGSGQPFNDRHESFINGVGGGVKYIIWSKK